MEHTLPPDLVTATAAVVGVTGLADGHLHVGPNAARWEKLERSLMDLLSVRTNLDGTLRTPLLLFQKLAREQNYPLRKMRMSLGTNTRGILKANWLHKHKVVLPGLLLMFFPFDPAEADWRERDALIVSEVQDRKYARSRSPPPPPPSNKKYLIYYCPFVRTGGCWSTAASASSSCSCRSASARTTGTGRTASASSAARAASTCDPPCLCTRPTCP